jgi:hypothetical protein
VVLELSVVGVLDSQVGNVQQWAVEAIRDGAPRLTWSMDKNWWHSSSNTNLSVQTVMVEKVIVETEWFGGFEHNYSYE